MQLIRFLFDMIIKFKISEKQQFLTRFTNEYFLISSTIFAMWLTKMTFIPRDIRSLQIARIH